MSDFPPGSSAAANAKSPAYADALLRARQVRTSITYIITSIFLDNDLTLSSFRSSNLNFSSFFTDCI